MAIGRRGFLGLFGGSVATLGADYLVGKEAGMHRIEGGDIATQQAAMEAANAWLTSGVNMKPPYIEPAAAVVMSGILSRYNASENSYGAHNNYDATLRLVIAATGQMIKDGQVDPQWGVQLMSRASGLGDATAAIAEAGKELTTHTRTSAYVQPGGLSRAQQQAAGVSRAGVTDQNIIAGAPGSGTPRTL